MHTKKHSFVFFLFFCFSVYAVDSHWSKVLGADIIAGPIAFDDRVYVATEDRSITCLNSSGHFLWNHSLPGRTAPLLSVSPTGVVLAFCENGTIIAFNSNGSFLWQRVENGIPLFQPFFGLDGRIFLVYKDSILCLYASSAVKWKTSFSLLHINSTPTICGLSGEGDLLIISEDSQLFRFSPYGELKERVLMQGSDIKGQDIIFMHSVPGGVIVGTNTGYVAFFDIRATTELLWNVRLSAPLAGITYGGGTIFSVTTDGYVQAMNVTDGSSLWTSQCGTIFSTSVDAVFDYGQFNVTAAGFAGAWSIDGRQLRSQKLPSGIKNSVLSSSGFAYASLPNWLLGSWRLETRIKTEKKTKNSQSYCILVNETPSWYQYIPESADYAFSLFEEISESLKNGKTGAKEGFYARELSRILSDTKRPSSDRARAASLLGQLGSSEYRSFLIGFCYDSFDPTLAEGLLWGLASSAMDPDGSSLAAITHLVRTAGPREKGVLLVACDSLYALIRYSQGDYAIEGTRLLSSFLQAPYDNVLANRARLLLAQLLVV